MTRLLILAATIAAGTALTATAQDTAAPEAPAGPRGPMDFATLDADGSGEITPEDAEARRAAAFAELDADGDGTVTADEEAPVLGGFTGDQRFFMGWAQVWRIVHREPYLRQLLQVDSHSPGEYRANGPVSHLPAFYDAFDVQPGDALYLAPEDRIDLW